MRPAQFLIDFACGAVVAFGFFGLMWAAWLAEYGASDECPPSIACE